MVVGLALFGWRAMGKNLVVIGLQWGDEGKGKVVDLLTDKCRPWPAFRAATTPDTRWSSAARRRFCR